MSRASQARRIAAAAAFGGGGLGVLGLGVLQAQALLARRWIGRPFGDALSADGRYGAGLGEPYQLVMLGDSSAAGLGVDAPEQTPGAILARGLAAISGRPVCLTTVAVVGADSTRLAAQVDRVLAELGPPSLAVVMIGANDVTHRIRPAEAVRALAEQVRRLRGHGSDVVVGTAPDLGTVEPITWPLRLIARRWSRQLAAAQTVGVVEAGGRTVSLADLLGPEFAQRPQEMFSADRFHPSPTGYARAAAAMLPTVCAALGHWPDGGAERAPDPERGEGVGPVAQAAAQAADLGGTEVTATQVGGRERGPRGRWAVLLRRRRQPAVPAAASDARQGDPAPDQDVGAPTGPGDATAATVADVPTG